MRDGWRSVRIGEVVTRRKEPVSVAGEEHYRLMGIRWKHLGAYQRGDSETSPAKAATMFRMRKGDFVFNRIDTDKGAFAVVKSDLDGALASNEFPTYRCNPDLLLAEYLWLYFQLPTVFGALRGSGSEGRARWKEADFETHQMALPPVCEQRRIADLFGALDRVSARSEDRLNALAQAANQIATMAAEAGEAVRLGEIADIQFGFAFDSRHFADSGIRLLRGDNIAPGHLRWDEARHWPTSLLDQRVGAFALQHNDVVVGMDRPVVSGGVRVALVEESSLPALLVQRVARIRCNESLHAEPLVTYIASEVVADRFRGGQTGAFVPHLAAKDIREMPVPTALLDGAAARTLAAMRAAQVQCRSNLASLNILRTDILAALLSGEHEIPESYDALIYDVEGAA